MPTCFSFFDFSRFILCRVCRLANKLEKAGERGDTDAPAFARWLHGILSCCFDAKRRRSADNTRKHIITLRISNYSEPDALHYMPGRPTDGQRHSDVIFVNEKPSERKWSAFRARELELKLKWLCKREELRTKRMPPNWTRKPSCRKENARCRNCSFRVARKPGFRGCKHTGAKQNLTQNGHSVSFKVMCFGVSRKAISD